MIQVPFYDMSGVYDEVGELLEAACLRVLRSNCYIGGSEVEAFEHYYAEYTNSEYCCGVANGLAALHLSLLALDVGPGDEVLVPSNTFIATWLAVSHCGATPVPVEPDPLTHTISVQGIEGKITWKTKAIIPVHLYGQSVDIQPIIELGHKHNIAIIEDAAQAHGACYRGVRIGAHSDVVAWSFYPGKNLGALGDAGGITTNRRDIAEKVVMLRNYGSKERYRNEIIGFNARLDPMQAAVLSVKLEKLEDWNQKRRNIANIYSKEIVNPHISTPVTPAWSTPVWHQYVIRSSFRDQLQQWLKTTGIDTLIHYPIPPHRQLAYKEWNNLHQPVAELLAKEILSLPIFPQLTSMQLAVVINAVNSFSPLQ